MKAQKDEKIELKDSSKNIFLFKFFAWLRKLFYLWIRSKSLPKNPKDFEWDPLKPVCYVMNSHFLTDVFVLDKHCQEMNLPRPQLSLKHLNNPGDGAYIYLSKSGLFQKKRSKSVPTGLFKILNKVDNERKDIQLIPISIFWGRSAGKEEKSIFKMLFFDDEHGGWLQRFILFFVQGRNVFCNFGKPISLLNFVEQEKSLVNGTKKLRRVLRVHFHKKRESLVGPYLYDRRRMMRSILNSKSMKHFFEQEVEKKGKSRAALEKQAIRYLDEIAANMSPHVVRFADVVMKWIFSKLYRGIEVQHGEKLRELAESYELVYLPCHRSHMDYLLLGYTLYQLGVTPPHTAAGVNLNFWPIGALFRRGGAFFIRRSFGGNKLYSAVFSEYVNFLISGAYSMCFYIEGGRSRTGQLLNPKLGMLSMVVKSSEENNDKPVLLVPTYISYDKLIEARSYFRELKGKTKKAESLWQLFRMPKLLSYEFGKAYINFSKPIPLKDYLDSIEGPLSTKVSMSSVKVMKNINRGIYLNPISLIAIAMLSLSKKAIPEEKLVSMVNTWLSLLRTVRYDEHCVLPEINAREHIRDAEALAQINRFEHSSGDVIFVSAKDSIFLSYYRNNSLPLFIIPSLIANILTHSKEIERKKLLKIVTKFYTLLSHDFFLKWDPEEVLPILEDHLSTMADLKLLKTDGDKISVFASSTDSHFFLQNLGQVLGYIVERYSLFILLLQKESSGKSKNFSDFSIQCENLAKKSSILNGQHDFDTYNRMEFRQFMETLEKLKLLKKKGESFELSEEAFPFFEDLKEYYLEVHKDINDMESF